MGSTARRPDVIMDIIRGASQVNENSIILVGVRGHPDHLLNEFPDGGCSPRKVAASAVNFDGHLLGSIRGGVHRL